MIGPHLSDVNGAVVIAAERSSARAAVATGAVQEPALLDDVLVVGRRGAARIAADVTLSEAEIAALGAYDIGEAVRQLSRNRALDAPVLLINGRAVTNPADYLGFPPDALTRVEILPAQAAGLYGEDPARPVLNLVLKPEFRSLEAVARAARPSAGRTSVSTLDVRQSEIRGDDTFQLGGSVSRQTMLRGAERPTFLGEHPDQSLLSLRPEVDALSGSLVVTRALGQWSASVSSTAQTSRDRSVFGAAGKTEETQRRSREFASSAGLAGKALGWSTRLGLQGRWSESVQSGAVRNQTRQTMVAADVSMNRSLLTLPAGPVFGTLSARLAENAAVVDVETNAVRYGFRTLEARALIAAPLVRASRPAPLRQLGELSLTLGGSVTDAFEDGAGGWSYSGGVVWSPKPRMNFNVQLKTAVERASSALRFAPVILGQPRVVYDFINDEAVEIRPLLGGNPDLRPQSVQTLSLSASIGPFTDWNAQARLGLVQTQSEDGFGAPPDVTPVLEATFPDRFVRDAAGRLVGLDQRPLNLASSDSTSLTSGLNLSLPANAWRARPDVSVQISLNHTWQLRSRSKLYPGGPMLDAVKGDGGGGAGHLVAFQMDATVGAWALNGGVRWQSGARVRRDVGRDGPDDLERLASRSVDLRLSYQFNRRVQDEAGATSKAMRVEVSVVNLFDERPMGRLADGRSAPGYGRDDQDPMGRTIEIILNRRF